MDEESKGGRPRLFKTPEEMQEKIDEYFIECGDQGNNLGNAFSKPPPTMSGLCYYLGFAHRDSLNQYSKYPEFSDTVKRAKLRIENILEQGLWGGQCTGIIFNLKNNFGWKDKVETENTHKVDGKVVLWGNQDTE